MSRALRSGGKCWVMRFKVWKAASFHKSRNKVDQSNPERVEGPRYATREEAAAHCYRDVYAKVHANIKKFKFRAPVKRKNAMNEPSVQREPARATKDLHDLSRKPTLRPRNLQAETPKRPASSQQAGAQSKRVRVGAKPQMSKKQLRQRKQVQELSAKESDKLRMPPSRCKILKKLMKGPKLQ